MSSPTTRPPGRPGWLQPIAFALSSRRTLAVALLSFSSGLPLGLMMYSIPKWMSESGFDIRVIGLITLAQAPWTFKPLWSPLLDRYTPPWLGRRRGWIVSTQLALMALILVLAASGAGHGSETAWVILAVGLAIAFAAASQDIVVDAYAVEVLEPSEQGVAVGMRVGFYRVAMFVAGGFTISATTWVSWPTACAFLAMLFVPLLLVTRRAPEPGARVEPPQSLRDAVWLPFLGFLARHRALEILAFVVTYKLADNLADSLLTPFLDQMGYSAIDIGAAKQTFMLIATLVGTLLGGASTAIIGLGRALWVFGVLQVFSNLGYVWLAEAGINRPLLYAAVSFEALCKGLGMGAFGVLLLRLTQKRFSATQYALFSSLFALPRLVAGPIAGFAVHEIGWTGFYWLTILAGIPGLVLLARFVPPRQREPVFTVEDSGNRPTLSPRALAARGFVGGSVGAVVVLALLATLTALQSVIDGHGFAFGGAVRSLLAPQDVAGALRVVGIAICGLVCGLLTAAVGAARGAHRP